MSWSSPVILTSLGTETVSGIFVVMLFLSECIDEFSAGECLTEVVQCPAVNATPFHEGLGHGCDERELPAPLVKPVVGKIVEARGHTGARIVNAGSKGGASDDG